MLIIYGTRKARIKKYSDNSQGCKSCGAFDLNIKVYRKYYHVFFIPVIPIGAKTSTIRCNNCSEPLRSDTFQKQYENISKTPFYFYTMLILFALPFVLGIIANMNNQNEKIKFIEKPEVGDIYTIRKEEKDTTRYYFLRVAEIHGDTIVTYHNKLEYANFVYKLNYDDYFVKDDELIFTKSALKQMLAKMEINSVDRNYGNDEGFKRTK